MNLSDSSVDNSSEVGTPPGPPPRYRFIMDGDSGVGKTALIRNYDRGTKESTTTEFHDGIPRWVIEKDSANGKTFDIEIKDQRRHAKGNEPRELPHYTDFNGLILVCSLDSHASLASLSERRREMLLHFTDAQRVNFPCVMLTNKCDIPDDERIVTDNNIQLWSLNARCPSFKTSTRPDDRRHMRQAVVALMKQRDEQYKHTTGTINPVFYSQVNDSHQADSPAGGPSGSARSSGTVPSATTSRDASPEIDPNVIHDGKDSGLSVPSVTASRDVSPEIVPKMNHDGKDSGLSVPLVTASRDVSPEIIPKMNHDGKDSGLSVPSATSSINVSPENNPKMTHHGKDGGLGVTSAIPSSNVSPKTNPIVANDGKDSGFSVSSVTPSANASPSNVHHLSGSSNVSPATGNQVAHIIDSVSYNTAASRGCCCLI